MAIKVRPATPADLPAYRQLQAERWSDANQATLEQLHSRLRAHPQGMLVAEEQGRVVGMVYAMRLSSYNYDQPPSWYEVTHNGYCDNHDPHGPIIFGVDLSTAKDVGHRAGDILLTAIGSLAIAENIQWCLLGGRLPGYHAYQAKMSAEDYLWSRTPAGDYLDPQVRFYTGVPGLRPVKVLPHYFHDPESCDYGVLLRWRNPLYQWPGRRLWSTLFPWLFRLEGLYLAARRRWHRRQR